MFLFGGKLPSFQPRERKCLEYLKWSSWCNMTPVYPTENLGLQNTDTVVTLVMG